MAENRTLTLGYSPCPNDTFIFHALVHGIVRADGLRFSERLEDVETLNRLAAGAELDVTKISYGAAASLLRDYVLLRSGGALGRGCGPLIVARATRAGLTHLFVQTGSSKKNWIGSPTANWCCRT